MLTIVIVPQYYTKENGGNLSNPAEYSKRKYLQM